ncbi:MAG: AAA family ATPase, partial [Burkholderiaceae bacterium]
MARRLVDVDPYRESSVQVLMHLYEKSGNRGLALHAYHTCASLLASDLGIEPGEQLRQIKSILLSRAGQTSEPARIDRHMVGHRKRPLIGRDQELLQIEAQRQTARDGKPMLVLITGEAGIGKTTLLNRFTEGQESSAMPALVARCFSGEGELPYSPIVNWLQNIDCESLLPQLSPAFRFEAILAFPELLKRSVDVPNIYAHPPNRARGRLFEAIARLLEAVNRPITLVLDDIQWADKDTMEWIRFLFRSRSTIPVLVLATLRDVEIDNSHPIHALTSALRQASQLHEIPLKPLQEQEILELIEKEFSQSAKHSGKDDTENAANRRNALASLASRFSGGNPLFALEIVRHQLSAIDVDSLEDVLASMPPVIQSVLEAQLHRLSATAKSLADITAVAGRHITPELIEKVGDAPDEDCVGALEELWDKKILRETPNGSYAFRHELIREVCYELLSPPRRRSLHARIASALSSTMSTKGGPEVGQIAMHYRLAGQIENAYQWSCKAAAHAENSLAVRDAITFLDDALSSLTQLDPGSLRVTDRVKNLLAMSKLIALVEGFSAPRVVSLCGTITSLLPKVQDAGLKQQVMLRLRQLYSFGGFPRRALRLTNELIDHSMRGEDPLQQVEAYRLRSITQIQIGQFGPACESMKIASKIAEAAIKTGTVPLINTPFSIPMLHTIWAMVATVMGQA